MRVSRRLVLAQAAAAASWALAASPSAAQPRRPVIVIPGMLGSKLANARGEILWGNRDSLGNFGRLDINPADAGTDIRPVGFVEKIRVLGPFWTVHAYEELLVHLRLLGFVDQETLFQFPYDWRLSNFETARHFDSWLHERSELRDGKFDIIAHSMGGIVAKIWMLEHGGAQRVQKAIYLGTPFLGSMNTMGTLTQGWGLFANHVAGGLDLIRQTILSFPSAYELFPSYPGSCRLGDQAAFEYLNVYDPAQWNERGWLPPDYRDGGPRAAAFRSNIGRAELVADLMSRPIPEIEEVKVAGDNQDTRLYLYVSRADQSWRGWTFTSNRGDGTVPIWSAANSFGGDLAGTLPSFVEHATIFRDEWVKEVLQRELVITAPPPKNGRVPEIPTRSGVPQPLLSLNAELKPPIAAPGAKFNLIVTLKFPASAQIRRGDVVGLSARIANLDGSPVSLTEITDEAELAEKVLTFTAAFSAPTEEEIYRIDIDVPPLGQRATYLAVENI